MYQYLAGSLENQVCRIFHCSIKIAPKTDGRHFYKRYCENLVMNCCSCKIYSTQFISSGYTFNTLKGHDDKLIFILVETEIK